MVTTTVVEITATQYYEMLARRKGKARFAAFERVVKEALKKFTRAMDESEIIGNDMAELQSKRRERARIHQAIRGGTATRKDRQLFEKSKDLDDDYE